MRLAIVSSHPIQYYSPWFRYLASQANSGQANPKRVPVTEPSNHPITDQTEPPKHRPTETPPHRPTAPPPDRPTVPPSHPSVLRPPSSVLSPKVFYLWDGGANEQLDPGFGVTVK